MSETIPLSRSEQWTVETGGRCSRGQPRHGVQRLGVAFSGGVDSSLLLVLAMRTLSAERVMALLGVSPSLAAEERSAAHDVASQVGVRLVEVVTHEGDRPEYQANGPDRCFYCKEELFSRIEDEIADRYRLDAIAYGENADDARRPDRPGARAAANHKVLRPLAEAGMSKLAVRTQSHEPWACRWPTSPLLLASPPGFPTTIRSHRPSCVRSSVPNRHCGSWDSAI